MSLFYIKNPSKILRLLINFFRLIWVKIGIIFIVALSLSYIIWKIYLEFQLPDPDPVNVIDMMLYFMSIVFFLVFVFLDHNIYSIFSPFNKKTKKSSLLMRRMITAFSISVALPAILVAIFSTYFFNVSIQSWFNNKISTVLDQSTIVANSYVAEHVLQLKETAVSIAVDLNSMYYDIMYNSKLFNNVLNSQAEMRSLDEAIVFQRSTNTILAQTSLSFSLSFVTIPEYLISKAEKGEVVYIKSDSTKIRFLIKLQEFQDTYLLVGRLIDRKVMDHINKTSGATAEYLRLKNHINVMQAKFSLVFILLAISLILSAIYFARKFAENMIRPIRELVLATEKVKNGDLSVQVPEHNLRKDELKILSLAFNRMINQLSRQQKELIIAQRSLAWSDVARKVAHEIKNPLTPIQLSADMLSRKFKHQVDDGIVFEKYIHNIQRNSNAISNIVSEFVNFARLPAPVFNKCDIALMLSEIIDARAIINTDIEYKFDTDTKSHDFVCDHNQIYQVMINLLKNSEEAFLGCNTDKKSIYVSLKSLGNNLEISVTDNAVGFSNEMLNEGIKAYITSKTNGSGLGLAIVERIIQDHFGSIAISNNDAGGGVVLLNFDVFALNKKLT